MGAARNARARISLGRSVRRIRQTQVAQAAQIEAVAEATVPAAAVPFATAQEAIDYNTALAARTRAAGAIYAWKTWGLG